MPDIPISGILDHTTCVTLLRLANMTPPVIPAGFNTITKDFITHDGLAAIVVNQTGFRNPENGTEVNGCCIFVCLDASIERAKAHRILNHFFDSLMTRGVNNRLN